jgi:NAD(P)-dependent dehydrogenase (short-subunit alcohol dehydrogenase family)
MELTDRVVIVTGGGGGVGIGVTLRWLAAGARVLIVGQTEASLVKVRDTYAATEGADLSRLEIFPADISNEEGATAMVAHATSIFGTPPDTLLHLVGAFQMGPLDAPDAPNIWRTMLSINLDSSFYCYRAMLPALRQRGGGWIVGLGSRAALAPGAQLAAYAAAKAGLVALTQSLAAEVRDENIHVNVLLASTIDTPANRKAMGEKNADKWVTPDDIADATLYVCSPQARAVHGATLEVYARA